VGAGRLGGDVRRRPGSQHRVAGELKGGGFSNSHAPAQQALRLMQQRLDTGLSQLVVVFTSDTMPARSAAFERLEAEALAGLKPRTVPGLLARADLRRHRRPLFVSKRTARRRWRCSCSKVPMDTVQEEIPPSVLPCTKRSSRPM